MENSKLYVPNATLWVNYFKRKRTNNQTGGGSNIVPVIDRSSEHEGSSPTESMKVDLVSPVEAASDRVKNEVKRKRDRRKSIKRRNRPKKAKRLRKRPRVKRRKKAKAKVKRVKRRDIFD